MSIPCLYMYYSEHISEEQLLFASEIGLIYGMSGRMVKNKIDRFCYIMGIDMPRYFYKARYGLFQVDPELLWRNAMIF